MIRHLFKLIWNRKRANVLIITEILLSFLVLAGVTTVACASAACAAACVSTSSLVAPRTTPGQSKPTSLHRSSNITVSQDEAPAAPSNRKGFDIRRGRRSQ